jgi:RimJ/RimL family protein N-acetyltransferase
LEDAPLFLKLYNSPKWKLYIRDNKITTLEKCEAHLKAKVLPMYVKHGFGNYTVFRLSDNVPVGSVSLYKRDTLEQVDIGYALLPQYEGNGYAIEASTKLLELARESFGLTAIQAITTHDNIASQTLLGKLGLELKGTFTFPEETEELLLYHKDFI